MKKTYIAPACKVKRIETENFILAASTLDVKGDYSGNETVLSRKNNLWNNDMQDNGMWDNGMWDEEE